MKTTVAISSEIDDLELAVKELTSQVKENFVFERNSIGIVYCDADLDVAELGELLHAELGIDIVGITTTAMVERHTGYNDMSIMLSILTADDVTFSIGCTEELSADSCQKSIKEAYINVRGKIQDDPKLILTFAPFVADITSENYVEILNDASGGVPVFGGVATDHYDLQYQKTFINERKFSKNLVFLLIAGNIKPIFAIEHHFGAKVNKRGVITKSKDNLIQRVDDQTFKEFVASMVPIPDEKNVMFHFESTPFIMELPDYEKDEQPVVRVLCTIDHETGAGGFLSKMPEGSTIYLSVFQRNNLGESCNGALSKLIDQMAKVKASDYSMIFISTCNGRHLLMGGEKNLESNIVTEKLRSFPPELNAVGFYAFGEMCPTGERADGTAKNRFHNISFALCAI